MFPHRYFPPTTQATTSGYIAVSSLFANIENTPAAVDLEQNLVSASLQSNEVSVEVIDGPVTLISEDEAIKSQISSHDINVDLG